MELLTDGSIRCAIEICSVVPNYYIGIAFKDWGSYMSYLTGGANFTLTVNEETTLYGYPIRVRPGSGGTIDFSNGSRLDMFVARENIPGGVYDEIFYEEGISEDLIGGELLDTRQILSRMERPQVHSPTSAGEALSNIINSLRNMPVMGFDDCGLEGVEGDITLPDRRWYPISPWDLTVNTPIKEDSCNVSESQQDLEFNFSKEEFDEFLGDVLKEQDGIYER